MIVHIVIDNKGETVFHFLTTTKALPKDTFESLTARCLTVTNSVA